MTGGAALHPGFVEDRISRWAAGGFGSAAVPFLKAASILVIRAVEMAV